nr:glycine zipper 2TM domain-containing protein [uncultured Cocleimonas sp.]
MYNKSSIKSVITTSVFIAIFSSVFVLSGCSNTSKESQGAIAGSVLGGVVGHQFGKGSGKTAMTVIGAVVGGMVGGNIGRGLDQEDQRRISQSLETTPDNQRVAWDNPNTKTNYEFTPINKYEGNVNGQQTQCRDYVMDAWIDGRKQQVHGRACKNSNGQWINAQ